MGQAGGVLLTEAIRAAGLAAGLSAGLASWRSPRAVHDPAKVVWDLAVAIALGVTASPTSRCCAPKLGRSGRWPRT